MAISMMRTLPDLSKMEPLDGTNFKRWSQKLLIFFEQLEVDYVLFTDPPEITTQTTDTSTAIITTSQTDSSRREDELKAKYEKDNRTFQIVDGKSIMDQLHEYENIVADVLNEDMKMREILQPNVLLEKFPPSWNDYRNHLKHKKRDLTLQELISHMRTEEANRLKDKEISNSSFSIKANLVEPSESSKDRFQTQRSEIQEKCATEIAQRKRWKKSKRTNINAIVVERRDTKLINATNERTNKRPIKNRILNSILLKPKK
ncbi:UNVERIFIED_CONTAM: hypothetical protein Sradi_7070000 [Sesamum radiatum]|uniref:Uncharacterized protein n=1 Tax=Sesamum radiatum TaxID=300843 RepID=A0AAW2J597_SESRA